MGRQAWSQEGLLGARTPLWARRFVVTNEDPRGPSRPLLDTVPAAHSHPTRARSPLGLRSNAGIKFKREPVYLPLAALNVAPHDRYAEAARVLPELVAARAAFVGRAVHSSPVAWEGQLNEALGKVR